MKHDNDTGILTSLLSRTKSGATDQARRPAPRLGIALAEAMELDPARPRIGLALGGGGARGAAHIGVLNVLDEAKIPVDVLAGTSMGGIVAAPYAAGFSAAQITAEARRLSTPGSLLKLIDWLPTTKGILQGQAVHEYFGAQLGEELMFEELFRKLAVTAVDLNTGQEVVISSGPVKDALRATMAIPGLVAPVELDGAKLVDGGILNNVPADVAREMGADIVIAVDVAVGRLITDPESGFNADQVIRSALLPSFALDMWRAQAIMMQKIVRYRLQSSPPDILINPVVPPDVTTLSFSRVEELIEVGEAAARRALPQIKAVIEKAM